MRQTYKLLIVLSIAVFGVSGCEDMDDKSATTPGLEVQNFIWRGLNNFYLWQADVPDLADDKFANQQALEAFFLTKDSPEGLFQDLLNKPISQFPLADAVDRFSVLVPDYIYLENLFQGITKNNGIDFSLNYKQGSTTEVFGWVRYIIPNSDAATKDIERGAIFYAVNGVALTVDNYNQLLSTDTYTLNLADYDNGLITPNGAAVTVTKTQLTENPVFYSNVIQSGSHKTAYLVYNGFTANFDAELNNAFAAFKTAGATDLVVDLRYNSGGSVLTASRLASMITGQFNGQVFATQKWNAKCQALYGRDNNFTNTVNDAALNSLNLSTVYILTTRSTASASELVINGLKPYINVVQIGTTTTGKNVGSITLYDSPQLVNKDNISTKHKYAMQPLVFKTVNKDGFGEYQNGLAPTIVLAEDLGNLSQLGNPNEPLLSTALGLITSTARKYQDPVKQFKEFKDSKSMRRFGTDMYINFEE